MLKRLFKTFLSFFFIAGLLFAPVSSFADIWGQNQKPVLGSQPDWSHPLTRGLVWCIIPGTSYTDMVSGNALKPINGAKLLVASKKGYAIFNSGFNQGVYTNFSNSFLTIKKDCTIIAGVIQGTWGIWGAVFDLPFNETGDAPYTNLCLQQVSSNSTGRFVINNGSSQRYADSDAGFFVDNDTATVLSVTRQNNSVKFYKDSKQFGNTATISENIDCVFINQTNPVFLNTYSLIDSSQGMSGYGIFCYIYNRALSPQEIQQLCIDPYCFIKQDYRLYCTPPAGTTYYLGTGIGVGIGHGILN